MTFSNLDVAMDYLARLADRRPECFNNPAYFLAKLAEESGEAVKEGNKRIGFSRHAPDPAKEAEELADTVICAYAQAIQAGFNLDQAIQAKHHTLMNRSWREYESKSPAGGEYIRPIETGAPFRSAAEKEWDSSRD